MKNILLLVFIPLFSLSQNLPSNWSDEAVRNFLDSKEDLQEIEGIYFDEGSFGTLKVLILYDDVENKYNSYIMEAKDCTWCENWRKGDLQGEFYLTDKNGSGLEVIDNVAWHKRYGDIVNSNGDNWNLYRSIEYDPWKKDRKKRYGYPDKYEYESLHNGAVLKRRNQKWKYYQSYRRTYPIPSPVAWYSLLWKNESFIIDFIDSKENLKEIEGIYHHQNTGSSQLIDKWGKALLYKFLIIYDDNKKKYNAYIISKTSKTCDGCYRVQSGRIKLEFFEGAIDGIYDVKWNGLEVAFDYGKVTNYICTSKYEGALIEGETLFREKIFNLIKLYPKLDDIAKNKTTKTGEWASNGSGIIISESGYIVTNYHVIKDADEIEVEFIYNDEASSFNADIVQVDKVNDLAIIKIYDMNFDGLDKVLYNFKTRSAEVGTKIYAYGYPLALVGMGKEVKVTDGIISSKTGFDGNITTYQITAPIQGGNSGGPLFDEKGNLIGINSSGIRKDVADNVGYTIKTNYILNLIDVLPKSIELPSSTDLESLPLTEQIKEISKYVVLIKIK